MSIQQTHYRYFTSDDRWRAHHIRALEARTGVKFSQWTTQLRKDFLASSDVALALQRQFGLRVREALKESHTLRVIERPSIRRFFETNLPSSSNLDGLDFAANLHANETVYTQAFELSGCQEYAPSSALSAMIRDTSIRRITPDDVRYPHRAFVVHVPPSARLNSTDVNGVVHPVTDVYVLVEDRVTEDPDLWGVGILSHGASLDPTNEQDNSVVYGHVPFNREVEPWLRERARVAKFRDVQTEELLVTFAWVMGVVLYVAGHPDDRVTRQTCQEREALVRRLPAATGKKKERLRQRISELRPGTTTIVGRNVTNAYLSEAPKDRMLIKVSGHWHRYWVGKGVRGTPVPDRTPENLRVRWVRPYWKGDGASETAAKVVRVLPSETETRTTR